MTNMPIQIWADPDPHILGCGKWRTSQDNAPWGAEYIKKTRVQMRLNAISEALELRDFDAAQALTCKRIE
jgi:hypothetical protein